MSMNSVIAMSNGSTILVRTGRVGVSLSPTVVGTFPIKVVTVGTTATVSIDTTGATTGEVLEYNGTGVVWAPGGGAPTAPQRLTFAMSGTALVASGADQPVLIDQSGGQGTYPLPATPADGQTFSVKDPTGAWATHPPILTVTGGRKIELPTASGTYSTTSATALAQAGGEWTLLYGATENTWYSF
jgi:hypothetical protein